MDINRKELSRIKEVLKDNPRGMTVTEISKAIGMNRHSVAKYMDMFVVSGHVDMRAFGPSKIYYLSTRLPISAMLSLSSDLIIILDKNLSIVNVNERFVEFTGIKRNDILNKSMEYFSFPIEFKPSIIPSIKNALNGQESRVDAYYNQKNREFDFIVKFIPTVFDDGEKGVTVIFEDVTERKRIENAIRESEQKFRNIIEQSSDGLILADERGIVIEYNKSCEIISGFNGKDMIGKPIWEMPFMFTSDPENRKNNSREATLMLRTFIKTGNSPMANQIREYDLKRPDGEVRKVQVNAFPIKSDKGYMICGIARDITDLKKAETSLAESEEKFKTLADTFADGILIFQDKKLVYNNLAASNITGHTAEELVKTDLKNIVSGEHLSKFEGLRKNGLSFGEVADARNNTQFGMKIITPQREEKWLDVVVWSSNFKGNPATIVVFKDVTARKKAEEALIKAHDELEERVMERTIQLQKANVSLRDEIEQRTRSEKALKIRVEFEKLITELSTSFINLKPDEIDDEINRALKEIGQFSGVDRCYVYMAYDDLKMIDETHEWCAEGIQSSVQYNQRVIVDERFPWISKAIKKLDALYVPSVEELQPEASVDKGSLERLGARSVILVPMVFKKSLIGLVGFSSVRTDKAWTEDDISLLKIVGEIFASAIERKRIEGTLRDSEEKFRSLVENINDIAWEMDKLARFAYVSPKIRDILGYDPEYYVGKVIVEFMPPEDIKIFSPGFGRIFSNPRPYSLENLRMYHKDGRILSMEVNGTPFYDDKGEFCGFRGVTRDITGRKISEEELRKSNRALELITSCDQMLVRAKDETALLEDICNAIVNIGGYRIAWIGYAEDGENKPIRTMAKGGLDEGYLDILDITWADVDHGRGPTGTAIRNIETCIIRNTAIDPRFKPWREEALQRGLASAIAIPLVMNGHAFGALTIYSAKKDTFDTREVELLNKLADDISYGIVSLRARARPD